MTPAWSCAWSPIPPRQTCWRGWEEWEAEGRQFAASALLPYEVSRGLYRYQQHGYLTGETAAQALSAALALPIQLYAEAGLQLRALQFAQRLALPAFSAAHDLALAEHLGAELWTADPQLAAAVGEQLPWVRFFE